MEEPGPAITLRAVLLGVVSFWAVVHLLFLSVSSQLPVMVLISFVFWLFFNSLLRTFVPQLALRRGELLTIFTTGWVAGTMPLNGWMWDLVAMLPLPTHIAGPENRLEEVLFDILPWHVFASTEPRVVDGYWYGLDPGETVPWEGWVGPIGQWFSVSMGTMVFGFCIFVLFQRHWVEGEKLSFPLSQMPLDLTLGCEGPGRVPDIFKSRLFWVGVVVVFLPAAYNVAGYFLHGLPKTKIFFEEYSIDVGENLPGLSIRLMPLVLAVAYLCPLDILASLIVFYWVALPKQWIMNRTGFTVGTEDRLGTVEILHMESYGALIFIALWSIWLARGHLRAIWRQALFGEGDRRDTRQYRWALFGLLVSGIYVTGWIMALGASLPVAAGLLLLYALGHFVAVKLMAATGFAYLFPNHPHLKGESFIRHLVGTRHLSPGSVVGLKLITGNVFMGSGSRIPGWPAIAHHLRIFSIKRQPVWVTASLLIAFGVGFVGIAWTTIDWGYGVGTKGMAGNDNTLDDMVRLIDQPTVAAVGKWAVWLTGFFEAGGIAWLRMRFHWFPFHPVGLAFQHTAGSRYWFSLLVVWLVKFTLLRYGGVRLYNAGKPLLYGLTVGYVIAVVLARGVDRIWFPGVSHWLHRW